MGLRETYSDLVRQLPPGAQPRGSQLLGSIVFQDEKYQLEVLTAASVSTVKGVVRIVDRNGTVLGYLPVYQTYA